MTTLHTTISENDAKPADDEEVFESRCGVGSCRPQFLQCFKNVLSFSIFFGLATMTSQSLNIYINSQVTALEKQFDINSVTTGIILSCNDIGFICAALFIGHFGSYGNIPRVLSFCTFLFGVSGIFTSLCHFIDPYQLPKLSIESVRNSSLDQSFVAPLCDPGNTTSNRCGEKSVIRDSGSQHWVVWLLGASMVLQGVGKSPRLSLSTAYVDDNNPVKTKTGLYLAIIATLSVLGPSSAVVLGGVFRTIPVDLQDTVLTPRHPEWIGAWWLGFLLFGCLGVIFGIPLLFFPKQIVPTEETQSQKKDVPIKAKLKELPRSVFRVLRNPVCSLTLTGMLLFSFASFGLQSFTSKYVENQFMASAFKTNVALGVGSLISLTTGIFTGGLLTTRLKSNRVGYIKLTIMVHCIALLGTVAMFFLGCDTPVIHGFHDKGVNTFKDSVCSCDSTNFFPVCGDDGMTYFSPCFAGCTNQTLSMYGGCSKVTSGQTTAGMCVSDCPYFYYYIAVDLIQKLLQSMSLTANIMTLVRSVEAKDKAMVMAMLSFSSSLLVLIPSPIVFGYVIDTTCLIWERSCGVRGACGQYDLEALRYRLVGGDFCFRAAGLFFFCLTFLALKLQGDDKPSDEKLELTEKTDKKTELPAL